MLSALRARGADPARLVHHAERAGDDDTLVVVAPLAARAAAAAGAHREAAAHYRRALELADRYPEVERADLLEAFTVEASTTCLIGDAMRAAERALALREAQARAIGGGPEPALDEHAVLVERAPGGDGTPAERCAGGARGAAAGP